MDDFLNSGTHNHECKKKDCFYCRWLADQAIRREKANIDSYNKFCRSMNLESPFEGYANQ